MGETTKISWCDHTFNPWRGTTGTRVLAAPGYWRQPLGWDAAAAKAGVRRRVFCASNADVFETWDGPIINPHGFRIAADCCFEIGANLYAFAANAEHPTLPEGDRWATLDDARLRLFDTIRQTQNLDWLQLTKRPEEVMSTLRRVRELAPRDSGDLDLFSTGWMLDDWLNGKPPANVWLMTSVEDQATANMRLPHILKIPAVVRGVSAEPLLGPVDFTMLKHGDFSDSWLDALRGTRGTRSSWVDLKDRKLHWVICGGESGPHARPFDLAWARAIRDQCNAAGVAYFLKQLGAVPWDESQWAARAKIGDTNAEYNRYCRVRLKNRAGADPAEWPEDLRGCQEWPKGVTA